MYYSWLAMERWKNQVAIVTGASSGIGVAIVENLVRYDVTVVGLSRRKELLNELSEKLKDKKFYGIQADIRKEDDILKAFKWVKENVGPVSILINNAGIVIPSTLIDGETSDFKNTFDTNVLGLTITTREAVRNMRANGVDGHIIHINSIVGHYVAHIPKFNVCPASKHAVTALTETLRQELNSIQSKIKITSISPGAVDTDLWIANGFAEDNEVSQMIKVLPKLNAKDIADGVIYVLGTPPHVQITELTIRPVGEPF